MSNDVVIQVDALSKRYRLGVVGTGKSTLLKILSRVTAPPVLRSMIAGNQLP